MAKQENSLAHTKWLCKYHIVFAPKYRRKIIYNQYRESIGNRFPFCCALFTESDAREAGAVMQTLAHYKIRCAVPKRRLTNCISRAAVILLFLSPEAVRDKAVLKGIGKACVMGKTILTVFLTETRLTPGLSMQLGQMQAIPKFREESDEAFYRKLLKTPALQTMSVTSQQKKALRRHTLLWAIGGTVVLTAAVLIGLNWRPLKAMLPSSPLRRIGVPPDFENVETLYVYGETQNASYEMPRYRIYADGENDWAQLSERAIPQGSITKLDDFALLTDLKELCICNNRIDSIKPILSLKQLTLLDVSHNRIPDFNGIGALSELETLNVSHNDISELDEIANLRKLRILNVAYTDAVSLEPLLSAPSLETVYIDSRQLDTAKALGETPFEIVCLDTPVYRYSELAEALHDPLVTDICIMKTVTVPHGEEIRIRPGVVLTERDSDISISVYGTVRVEGVWKMTCKQSVYGTIAVENGGVCTFRESTTVHCGQICIEKGGRHNLTDGATFIFVGGNYENNGEVSLQGAFHIQYKASGSLVNNGALYLRTVDFFMSEFEVPNDNILNNGIVYVDGVAVLDGAQSEYDKK